VGALESVLGAAWQPRGCQAPFRARYAVECVAPFFRGLGGRQAEILVAQGARVR